MTTGSLGLRSSGSYGSLQQIHNASLSFQIQITPPLSSRKPQKMFKDKESLFHWIFKFAPRRKVGMLFLCLISAAVFVWVLYVGKGEDAQEPIMQNINIQAGTKSEEKNDMNATFSPLIMEVKRIVNVTLPSPPSTLEYFTGYKLPPGNPCEHFTLPPPPADKKRTGPRPCPVCYLPLEDAIALMPSVPSFSPVVKNLRYIHEDNLTKSKFGGSEFGGYPSLRQRDDSYDIRESMCVHCGFVRGVRPGRQTGFDIGDSDLVEMESCRGVVVASAIFGAFDLIRQPKNISEYAQKHVCFHMFVDEETEAFLRNSNDLGSDNKVGMWRVIVVRNLPYSDPRRNGKVPKLLLHRLFPNSRYSLWVDAKLELVVDPFQILERFLWRKNASFAISRHYKRFDVFLEAEANKAAAKYDNASIDFQIQFYKKEGLTPYSEEKLPITSDVPEGCVIVKEHIPISNLFTCLWFNEVDRFTSRDQISFSTVRDKIHSKTNYTINMFLDCERRNFVVQLQTFLFSAASTFQHLRKDSPKLFVTVLSTSWSYLKLLLVIHMQIKQGYHRDILERWSPPPPPPPPLPPSVAHAPPLPTTIITNENHNGTSQQISTENMSSNNAVKVVPMRRGRDRRSRRHRKVIITGSTEAITV